MGGHIWIAHTPPVRAQYCSNITAQQLLNRRCIATFSIHVFVLYPSFPYLTLLSPQSIDCTIIHFHSLGKEEK